MARFNLLTILACVPAAFCSWNDWSSATPSPTAKSSASASPSPSPSYITYSTVPGYFLQDLNTTNASTFSYSTTNFGLINQTYPTDTSPSLTQWQRFNHLISTLITSAPKGTTYKLLFMGRHGEGYHNAAETYYGTPAWNCYWSLLDGNTTTSWADAQLTSPGIAQALIANKFWSSLITTQHITPPQSYYTSPLYRCLSTANLTFTGLPLPATSPFVPTVKELLRESISEHTCDRRSNASSIHSSFPTYKIEAGFAFSDPFWTGTSAETDAGQDIRSKKALDDIFSHDSNTYLSITSHSGEIGSILRVLGHIPFSLNTGAVIPVLVKAVTVHGTSTTSSASMTPSPHCTVPPLSSVSGGVSQGCSCPAGAAPVTNTLGGIGTYAPMTTASSAK